MDSAGVQGPLLCVLSGLGHWILAWVRSTIFECKPSFSTLRLIHKKFTQANVKVAFQHLSKIFRSVPEKDLLYAANWAVSLLQVPVSLLHVEQIQLISGLCGHCHWDLWLYTHRIRHQSHRFAGKTSFHWSGWSVLTDWLLQVLVPYGWFNLGYWLYDLFALFHLANLKNKDSNSNDMTKGKSHCSNDARDHWENFHENEKPSDAGKIFGQWAEIVLQLVRRVAVFVAWWPGIVAHHLGIILFMAVGVLSPTRAGQGDGLITLGLLTELSSIFVAARGLLARLGLRESKGYLLVSIGMVVTFFLARILLVPAVIALYSSQVPKL